MVITQSRGNDGTRIVLRPNRSASWREVKIFLFLVSFVCLGVATGFALIGYWPVLPFAGAEIALLTYATWWAQRRAGRTEVVDIDEEEVAIEKGRIGPEAHWSFQRAWARVFLVQPAARLHPSRLYIGSHGQHVPIGGFLTEEERQGLAQLLRRSLTPR